VTRSFEAVTDHIVRSDVDDTTKAIADLHSEHRKNATTFQRAVEDATAILSNPLTIGVILLFILAWIAASLVGSLLGYRSFDPPPFFGLGAIVSISSLFMVIMILATQRHEDRLAFHREQLILELVRSSEQKAAKIIQLLEESRRDDPSLSDRVDHEANKMTQPADPSAILTSIKDFHSDTKSGR
jgi:uncharacterized membrane protein